MLAVVMTRRHTARAHADGGEGLNPLNMHIIGIHCTDARRGGGRSGVFGGGAKRMAKVRAPCVEAQLHAVIIQWVCTDWSLSTLLLTLQQME